MSQLRVRALAAAALILAATACSDSATEPVPDEFAIGLVTPVLQINRGGSNSMTVTLTRKNGYNGPVVVTAEELGSAITANADTIPPNQTVGVLVFTTTATTPVGDRDIFIRAQGEGTGSHRVRATVTVRTSSGGK